MILHVVFYQPKSTASAEDKGLLISALEAACLEIPSISQVRVGRAENLGLGYENRSIDGKMDFVAIFEFIGINELKSYLAHPEHQKLAEMFWKVCERTMIVDIEAIDPKAGGDIAGLVQ